MVGRIQVGRGNELQVSAIFTHLPFDANTHGLTGGHRFNERYAALESGKAAIRQTILAISVLPTTTTPRAATTSPWSQRKPKALGIPWAEERQ